VGEPFDRNSIRRSSASQRCHENVDKFVDAKAPDFNTFQQEKENTRQAIQFKASNFLAFPADFNRQ
jgi:hypothetical protein